MMAKTDKLQRVGELMLVTARRRCQSVDEYLEFVGVCARSGVTSVQLREKNTPYPLLVEFGKKLKEFLSPFAIPLIVNDDLNLAHEIDADGVHLGQSDGDPQAARELLGEGKIIGVTIDSIADLRAANNLPVDYVGCGAIFPTKNKVDVATVWGLDGLRQVALLSQHPVIAIGGIDETNAREVFAAGASGIAAIGAFHDAGDPAAITKTLCLAVKVFPSPLGRGQGEG